MNRILNKRIARDLKENFGRYFALTLLIVMGIYLVVSIVGAAEVVLTGTENRKSVNMVEDGQFTVFLPLSDKELGKLTQDGTVIEAMFSTDLQTSDGTKLRLFQNRENIDLIQLDEGRLAQQDGEAVIEKGYAKAHELSIGDTITAGGIDFEIVGLGTIPDYDQTLASFSDTAVEKSSFGLIFTTAAQYQNIRKNTSQKAEEYTYAYRLGSQTDSELKDKIKSLDFNYKKVENQYFQEIIDEILSDKTKLENGMDDLYDGSKQLYDGIDELNSHSEMLNQAADELFASYLSQVNTSLAAMGQTITLTKETYANALDERIAATG